MTTRRATGGGGGLRVVLAGVLAASAVASAGPTTDVAAYRGPRSSNVYVPLIPTGLGAITPVVPVAVGPIPDDLRRADALDPFYTKSVTVRGIPVIGSARVSDVAFLEAAYQLDHALADSPPWVIDALAAAKVRLGIISVVEYTTDIPENRTKENLVPREAAFQDRRSRGLGGVPLATCAEENLLNLHGDPYSHENITLHEFAHTLASAAGAARPQWYARLKQTYRQAMQDGLFAHSYSATDEQEYWAEGVQAWFDCAARTKDPKVHSGIWHRDQLKAYDPRLAALIAEAYGDGSWRYVKSTNEPVIVENRTLVRPPADLTHLAGLDRDTMPWFDFENSPRIRAVGKRP